MSILFEFSDESGDYKQDRTEKFNQKTPYYVRATLLLNASDWKELYNRFHYVKKKYKLPSKEIKWSYL
jgi:hypothetical protein